MKKSNLFSLALVAFTTLSFAQKKPNILVLWGDDIGQSNISAYTMGLTGYQTPNIDRIADEGMIFTDYYSEQSCTAGRSTFILGQSVLRTGLSKVGMPGAKQGISEKDPTIAELLKPHGYVTGQFGKNHLGDRDEMLPTNHGFDEFFGNLYHLNAEEEPELPDYPDPKQYPNFAKKYGPRGVIHSTADGKIEDTGPLTKKRMETIDDESSDAAIAFIKKSVASGKPFFVWWNGTRMHFRTHVKPELTGISGQNEYGDGMVEHDMHIGKFLKVIDELGIADNTIIQYGTDNGPHKNTWPDAGINPFRGEKNTNWEGGWRTPAMVRWPGKIKAGSISNEIMSGLDWMPTYVAIAGDADIKEKLLKGYSAGGKTFKVHLDGYNFLPYLTGEVEKGPREELFYFSDDGELMALRFNDWKVTFMHQDSQGTLDTWSKPMVTTRIPWIYNLRRDPYEFATTTSNTYWDWYLDHVFLLLPASEYVGKFIATFEEYPPRMKAASFNLGDTMDALTEAAKK
ncbi:arylsulfatase [Bizionia sp. KMM 8389]